MLVARIALVSIVISATAACSPSDAEVDAQFAEFCESNLFFRDSPECSAPDSLTREQKQEFLNAAPKMDAAIEKFEQEQGMTIEEMAK